MNETILSLNNVSRNLAITSSERLAYFLETFIEENLFPNLNVDARDMFTLSSESDFVKLSIGITELRFEKADGEDTYMVTVPFFESKSRLVAEITKYSNGLLYISYTADPDEEAEIFSFNSLEKLLTYAIQQAIE